MGKSKKYSELGLGDFNPRFHPTLITYFIKSNERINKYHVVLNIQVLKNLIKKMIY